MYLLVCHIQSDLPIVLLQPPTHLARVLVPLQVCHTQPDLPSMTCSLRPPTFAHVLCVLVPMLVKHILPDPPPPPLSLAASTPILCISSPRAQPDSSTFTCSLHPTLCMFQSVCWCVTSSLIPPLLLAASTTPPCAFTSPRTQPHSSILLAASTPRYACTIPGAHDDVIKWKHFSRHWPFVRGIHRSLANFPHKGQWRGALMFSLICVWINDWVNNREAGDLRRYRAHYDVIAMWCVTFSLTSPFLLAASTPYFTHVPVPLLVCHKEDTCHQNCSVHPFRLHDWCAEVWHIGLAQ